MRKFLIPIMLGFGSVVIFLPDLFRNIETVKNTTGHTSGFISCILLLMLTIVRIFSKKFFVTKKIKLFMLTIFLASFTLSVSLSLLNFATYANFIYSRLFLNLEVLMYISLASVSSWLLFQDKYFFKKHSTILLLALPIFFLVVAFTSLLLPPHVLQRLTREDSIVEYLQVIVLLIGSFSSFVTAKHLIGKNTKYATAFILGAVLLFFIAGDEISWGQRLVNLQTPAGFKNINAQNEITIHNISTLDGLVPVGYVVIGLYGSVISLFIRRSRLLSPTVRNYFFTGGKFFMLFFIPGLYNGYTIFFKHPFGNFSEPAELLLYLGISLFMLELSQKSRSIKI